MLAKHLVSVEEKIAELHHGTLAFRQTDEKQFIVSVTLPVFSHKNGT
jgi:hypothetical protein